MIRSIYLAVSLLLSGQLTAQVVDNFSDGNFTNNPTWSGTTADFIVNSSQQLQLNNTVAATSYLTTPTTRVDTSSSYYFIYNINDWVDMINICFSDNLG